MSTLLCLQLLMTSSVFAMSFKCKCLFNSKSGLKKNTLNDTKIMQKKNYKDRTKRDINQVPDKQYL